jgi:lipopolysaccharide transport system ATP-binding protein
MTFSIRCENINKLYKLKPQTSHVLAICKKINAVKKHLKSARLTLAVAEDSNEILKKTQLSKAPPGYFWALKNINLEIQQGDRVALIGRNGSGKSTLLKIFSRITAPTSGLLQFKGRLISLLEIGAGFHNELTGRENIFLNGSIMGMSIKEIKRCYENIVEFSELEKFIDTPVKHYSSGMYIRLAFSIAAHLESEILIIDEVLAVGDAAFQKKCLNKMLEISKQHGRTLLLVSHDMNVIHQICDKAIEMVNGEIIHQDRSNKIVFPAPIEEATKNYLASIAA